MNLGELIQYTRDHVLRDAAIPPLWPDDLLTRYFNDAEDQFARRTHILSDDESDFAFITTEIGVAQYALDPRVVFVKDIVHTETGISLRDASRKQLRGRIGDGRPTAYTLDAAMRSVRLHPKPDAEYQLSMLVARKPLNKLASDGDTPEIPEEYHLTLCAWVAYQCLRHNDAEAAQMVATADTFRAEWELAVRDAKREVYRLRTGPYARATGNWTGKRY